MQRRVSSKPGRGALPLEPSSGRRAGGPGAPGGPERGLAGGRAAGETGLRPEAHRPVQPSREAAVLCLAAVLASADCSREGARMPASGLCVSVECVFLGSLCALPLAAPDCRSGSEFYKIVLPSKVLRSFAFYWML